MLVRLSRNVALFALVACSGGDSDSDADLTPVCDGALQPGEAQVDAPWDLDGDDFYDASNPDCAAVWSGNRLDCDDGNPLINPGFPEIACNGVDDDCRAVTLDDEDLDEDGVGGCDDCDDDDDDAFPGNTERCFDAQDNNCDGVQDEGCGTNYNGAWSLDTQITMSCGPFGVQTVNVDFNQVDVILNPPYFAIGPATAPGALEGTLTDETFTAAGSTGADCLQDYTFTGEFTSPTTFEGVFTIDLANIVPVFNLCTPCPLMPQSFEVVGTKLP